MAVKSGIPVEEYLRMSFDGPDWEYVDGEIVERYMGDLFHSRTQQRLSEIFFEIRKKHPLFPLPELRHRVSPTRYRVPDFAVFAGREPEERIPSVPPYIAIEIASPDDRLSDIILKLEEYRSWGASHIWQIDPRTKTLFVLDDSGLHEVDEFTLPDYGIVIGGEQIFS